MSAQPFAKEIDPTRLVQTIIQKTEGGKLDWRETAKDGVFIVSVGGNTTMKVYKSEDEVYATLALLNESGKVLMEVSEVEVGGLDRLFNLARRIALKVDERLQSFAEELQRL